MGSSMTKEHRYHNSSFDNSFSPRLKRKRMSDPGNNFSKQYTQYGKMESKRNSPAGQSWTIDKSQYPLYDQSNRNNSQRGSGSQSSQFASFSQKEKFANDFSINTKASMKK